MNFGRLLAAGKSLVSGDVSGRYRMREHVRLPQFISPKNPFAADATVAEPVSPPIRFETSTVVSAVTPMPPQKLSAMLGRVGEFLKRVALWCVDHNPFSAIGRPRLSALPHFGKRAVQPELSLDKVEVVRGDLVHADLEVVNAGRASNLTPSAAWRNLTTRVFGGEAR
ncbi:MAG: hypothetical protein U1F83_06080 [Verrucomicrobiota bacterium]